MANYFVSYDLNGHVPTHAQMDDHMARAGWSRGRVLETVWYVKTPQNLQSVFEYINQILTPNDRLLVVLASNAHVRNLLIQNQALIDAWEKIAP